MLPRASLIIWHTLQPVEFPQVAKDETPQVAMHDFHRLPRYLFHTLSPPPANIQSRESVCLAPRIHSLYFLLPRPIFELNEAGMKCGNFCKECIFVRSHRESEKAISFMINAMQTAKQPRIHVHGCERDR